VALPEDPQMILCPNIGESLLSTAGAPVSRISAQYRELEKMDPLLLDNPRRFVMFPIQYP
jgi:hypothetical protein